MIQDLKNKNLAKIIYKLFMQVIIEIYKKRVKEYYYKKNNN